MLLRISAMIGIGKNKCQTNKKCKEWEMRQRKRTKYTYDGDTYRKQASEIINYPLERRK